MTIRTAIGQKLKICVSEGIGTYQLVTPRPIPTWWIVQAFLLSGGHGINTLHLSGFTSQSTAL